MKSIFTLALALSTCSTFCQEKLTGIGLFKINQTTRQQFEAFVKGINQEIRESDNLVDIYKGSPDQTGSVLKLIQNTKDKYRTSPSAPKLSDEIVYFINYYEIAGIGIRNIYLHFWKDTLYRLDCNSSTELVEAMQLKYGEPKVERQEKEVSCRSGVGVEYKEKETSIFSTWSNVPKIEAHNILSKYYDSKCKVRYINSFSIDDIAKSEMIRRKEISDDQQQDKLKAEEKKSKLKDF